MLALCKKYGIILLAVIFMTVSRRGGTGRRPGLKILWVAIPVPVRFRSPALKDALLWLCNAIRKFALFDYL